MPYDTHTHEIHGREVPEPNPQRGKPAPQRPDPCAEPCKPVCPACGGLECLCRPRFFPGQLLTDDDLNRLQRYVVEKNKLHNRYLHGWGVACGMEVVCNPCNEGSVIVRSGYALSPCGDDIVVCKDQSVDICDLVQVCRPERDPVCDPPYDRPVADCKTGPERWVLAICYDERPSRGITAMTGAGDSACGSTCACGGSGGCGCGKPGCSGGPGSCTGDAAQKGAATSKPRKAYKPQCEPTQICEGYRFTAYPAPPKRGVREQGGIKGQSGANNAIGMNSWLAYLYANRSRFGPLIERVFCCAARAMELRQTIYEGKGATSPIDIDVYLEYAEALRDFAQDFGMHRCASVGRVQQLYEDAAQYVEQVRSKRGIVNKAELKGRLDVVQGSFFDILSECFCSALLPGCPEPATSNCVPLAVVTLRRGNSCRVAEICNWEERRLLVTWRNVAYWLSWLPWDRLRDSIAKICCATDRQRQVPWLMSLMMLSAYTRFDGVMKDTAATRMKKAGGAKDGSDAALRRALDSDDLLGHFSEEAAKLAQGSARDAPYWAVVAANVLNGSALDVAAGPSSLAEMSRRLDSMQEQIDQLKK